MVFVESFGEGEGRLPWGLDLDPRLDTSKTVDVFLIGEDLY